MPDTTPSSFDSRWSPRIVGGFTVGAMILLLVAVFYLLGGTRGTGASENVVTLSGDRTLTAEYHLTLIVLLAGMLGACVHVATSFADYVGNGQYKSNWQWWYLLRPFIGGAVALIFYMLIRGGMLSLASGDGTGLPSAFGMAAMAALAGMFSKQATDKLDDVFDTLFKTDKDEKRQDGLQKPVITSFDPAEGHVGTGPQPLKVAGTGFAAGATVQVNGATRATTPGEGVLTVTLTPDDVAKAQDLEIRVANPDGALSEVKAFKVVDRRQAEGGTPDDRGGAPAGTTTTTTTPAGETTTTTPAGSPGTETEPVASGATGITEGEGDDA
jgi:hypothetical protein